jgi:multimeric flavodoxin WrbA
MTKMIILSASPKKGEPSVSDLLSQMAKEQLSSKGIQADIINVRKTLMGEDCTPAFETMKKADAMLIVFPLYFFCMPGMLTRYLEDYAQYVGSQGKPQKIYTIVNCGFPEPEINEEAIRVIQSFSRHIGASFRFGVGFGSGGMIMGAKEAPFMKKVMQTLNDAFDLMAKDMSDTQLPPLKNVYINVSFPRRLYYIGGNFGWRKLAKQNGLKKRDLYRRPYQTES